MKPARCGQILLPAAVFVLHLRHGDPGGRTFHHHPSPCPQTPAVGVVEHVSFDQDKEVGALTLQVNGQSEKY